MPLNTNTLEFQQLRDFCTRLQMMCPVLPVASSSGLMIGELIAPAAAAARAAGLTGSAENALMTKRKATLALNNLMNKKLRQSSCITEMHQQLFSMEQLHCRTFGLMIWRNGNLHSDLSVPLAMKLLLSRGFTRAKPLPNCDSASRNNNKCLRCCQELKSIRPT